jgi:UDP-N-acetylglucosamine 2-epimerase (non-hydrolysing)
LKNKKKIISVVGARPNFMKLAPIVFELQKYRKIFTHKIVHTGQHYDFNLSKVFFKDLDLPKPDIFLGAGSASHGEQTARIMREFEKVVLKEKPDLVIVFGDVNSTLACSLVCSKIFYNSTETIPVAHVEAGLRSFDKGMPEEINRVVTDMLSKYVFVTEKSGVDNLLNEGISNDKIFLTGDVMIDALQLFKEKFQKSGILKMLQISKSNYLLVTLHRPSNVDNRVNMKKIVMILNKIAKYVSLKNNNSQIIFPVHPRTRKMLQKFELLDKLDKIQNMQLIAPAGYTEFIKLLSDSKLVITDSGGIQEEATFLKVPCLTLRNTFERPETIKIGSNTLCGLDDEKILNNVKRIFEGKYKKFRVPGLMDGKAAQRIVKIIREKML